MDTEEECVFNRRSANRISETVRRVLGSSQNGGTTTGEDFPPESVFREGILASPITASTGSGTAYTTFKLTIYRGTGVKWKAKETITGTNRDDGLSAASGKLCVVCRVNGEWRPQWVGC